MKVPTPKEALSIAEASRKKEKEAREKAERAFFARQKRQILAEIIEWIKINYTGGDNERAICLDYPLKGDWDKAGIADYVVQKCRESGWAVERQLKNGYVLIKPIKTDA